MSVSFKLLFAILVCCTLAAVLWQYQSASVAVNPEVKTVATTSRSYFEPLYPWQLGGQTVYASLALTNETRALGLSYTSALPADIVKVFKFDTDERWSFWMKGMEYSIDIIWVTASGTIAHIETNVSPSTYPNSFTPPVPTRYVIETIPGLLASLNLKVGDNVDMASIIEKSN